MRSHADRSLFGIVVYETVEIIDVGGTYGVLSMARRVLPNLEMIIVAERAGPVRLAGGVQVLADRGFDDCPALDVAVVCGGSSWPEEGRNPAMLEFLRKLARDGTTVASVCTGGMILAAAGLLDGRAATTRRNLVGAEARSPLDRLAEGYPHVSCCSAAVVDAGSIVTGGGVTLAIDTTIHLLGRLYGAATSAKVAAVIEYTDALAANQRAIGVVPAPSAIAAGEPH